MLKNLKLLHCILNLFDEGAVAGAQAQAESGQPSQQSEETGEEIKVIYGKQPEETPAAEEPKTKTPEERRKAYDEYIQGEGKEFYTEDTQKMINRRFRETKGLQEENEAIKNAVAPLMRKYGIENVADLEKAILNDDDIWLKRAENEGLTVEQVKERDKLVAENTMFRREQEIQKQKEYADKQYASWMDEAVDVQKIYSDFDLRSELRNDKFRNLLAQGFPMMDAYEVIHLADIKSRTEKEVSKAVSENIKSRGNRPTENGVSNSAGVIVKSDPSQLSDAEMDEVIKRVRAGEKISF